MMAPVTAPAPPGDLETQIPDLTSVPLDKIAREGGTVLAGAIALYRERLEAGGMLTSAFNSGI